MSSNAANIDPVYPNAAVVGGVTLTTANNVYDGTGTIGVVMTAGADGAWITGVLLQALGTNVATLVRLFRDPGVNTTAANNSLIAEMVLPATTASATAALTPAFIPLNRPILGTHRITAVLATTVAAGWRLEPIAGNY